ncbi:hypothetical protein [Membranihabitans maritimus]|uniref:hypothetical protein n=1 Tax=Membranihabitans maritimus TaxID=2904244 RepID=UPI001F26DA67|nr:hypothetical protein [Membranihabitans maritimus]
MEEHIIRPRIFHRWVRRVILFLIFASFIVGLVELRSILLSGFRSPFELGDYRFVFSFLFTLSMILVYYDQERKSQFYIRWDRENVFYKLDSGPEDKVDLSRVNSVNANYSKVFFYMKDGTTKMVNFHSLNPRFKDVQEVISINETLGFRRLLDI